MKAAGVSWTHFRTRQELSSQKFKLYLRLAFSRVCSQRSCSVARKNYRCRQKILRWGEGRKAGQSTMSPQMTWVHRNKMKVRWNGVPLVFIVWFHYLRNMVIFFFPSPKSVLTSACYWSPSKSRQRKLYTGLLWKQFWKTTYPVVISLYQPSKWMVHKQPVVRTKVKQ